MSTPAKVPALGSTMLVAVAVALAGGCKPGSDGPRDEVLADARAKLLDCLPDDRDSCATYPGTPCLCATEASDPACDFRTAEDTNLEIADEAGGNECIATCIADASCERVGSERGCFAACTEQNCGPYRPINTWQACARSDDVAECLEASDCSDLPPADWVGGEGDDPPGQLEACIDACRSYFEPAGCRTTFECDEGSACLEIEPDIYVGKCTPIDGEIVSTVEVDAAPYANGCQANEDCVLAASSFDCECGYDGCGHVAVLADRVADYEAAREQAKQTCTPDLLCAPNNRDCFDDEERAECVESTCVVAGSN